MIYTAFRKRRDLKESEFKVGTFVLWILTNI